MSENRVLELLRAISDDMDNQKADLIEINERLGLLEKQYASIFRRLDRIDGRLDRVECRLDPTEFVSG
jgi:hypothetical protein